MIAEDSVLLRQGMVRLLADADVEVVDEVATAPALVRAARTRRPDAIIVDIRMPPTFADEGITAAIEVRDHDPSVGVLVLSQHLEAMYALRLLERVPDRVGYLLKERVSDIAVITDALDRITTGGCVLDPTIVARLLGRRREHDPLDRLTARELEVLAAMAEGRSNAAISRLVHLSEKTVEAYIGQVFVKLGLEQSSDDHRRVLAVLAFLKRSVRSGAT